MQILQLELPEKYQTDINLIKSELAELKKNYQPKEPNTYLTRQQTADLLHVDLSTLWNWKRSGKLLPVGLGKRVLYRRSDIDKAIVQLKN